MKMNKIIGISLTSILVTGCVYQEVDYLDLSKAKDVCGSYENIFYVAADFAGGEKVVCMNGELFNITSHVIEGTK